MSASNPAPWSSSYRLVAAEKWKAKSAALGNAVTEALVEYSRPLPDMLVLDLASGTGEPAISLAQRGLKKEFAAPFEITSAACIGCATCVLICPTGAIQKISIEKKLGLAQFAADGPIDKLPAACHAAPYRSVAATQG